MRNYKAERKLAYLLELIMKGRAISPGQLSRIFNCAPSVVLDMIARLRKQGHHITYSKIKLKYVLKDRENHEA